MHRGLPVLSILFALVWAPVALAAPQGVIVVGGETVRSDARRLARVLYGEPELRPAIDELTARALLGEAGAKPAIAETVIAITGATLSVQQRLLQSLGQQLEAELVVWVQAHPGTGTEARVLFSSEGRFLSLVLGAGDGDWPDAATTLRGLLRRAVHDDAAIAPHAVPAPAPPPPADDQPASFLSSPWFWGGLGTVLAVGVTVLVLSQTTLDEPGSVVVEGRVSP